MKVKKRKARRLKTRTLTRNEMSARGWGKIYFSRSEILAQQKTEY
jgi:hypothetical protein